MVSELKATFASLRHDRDTRVIVLGEQSRDRGPVGLIHMTCDLRVGLWANVDAPSLRHGAREPHQVLGCFTGNMTEAGRAFVERRPPE